MLPKQLFCFFILLQSISIAIAQDTTLTRILATQEDTLQVNQLVDYGRSLSNDKVQQAKAVLEKAITLSHKLNYAEGIGRARMVTGYMHAMAAHYQQAIADYKEGIHSLTTTALKDVEANSWNSIGAIYEMMGKNDSAMSAFLQGVKAVEHTNEKRALTMLYSNIGVLYGNARNFDKAVTYKQKALDIALGLKDTEVLIEVMTELADTYIEKGELVKSLPLAYKAMLMAKATGKDHLKAPAFYTMSTALLGLGKTDSAILVAKACLSASLACNDFNTYMGGTLPLADGYNIRNEQQARYDVLKESVAIAHKAGTVMLLDNIYERLADAAYKLGRYREAYDYHRNYTLYKDSVLNEKNTRIISELEMKYQTAQKEVQLQKSQQYTIYSIAATVIALLIAVVVFIYFNSKRKLHRRQLTALQQQQEIQRLHALMQGEEKERSRIAKELHDGIAGILAAVKMQLGSIALKKEELSNEYKQAVTLLDQAHEEVRRTSHNLMPEVLLKYGLDEALRRYCNNLEGRMAIHYYSYGNVPAYEERFELAIYRIVQELLGNVIKHARATEAHVQLSIYEALLMIEVADNGKGLGPSSSTTSIGFQSLKTRVQALAGNLSFDSRETGLTVILEFDTTGFERTVSTTQPADHSPAIKLL